MKSISQFLRIVGTAMFLIFVIIIAADVFAAALTSLLWYAATIAVWLFFFWCLTQFIETAVRIVKALTRMFA